MTGLSDDIERCAAETEAFLDACLTGANGILSGASPRLIEAMRHGTLGGGKRLRPFLLRATARLFGIPDAGSLRTGAAVELVHCYSLIHDDLPEMDNDRLRRGQPAVWAAFDPATAILAGDALLTLAFALLADAETHPDPAVRIEFVYRLSHAAGAAGMVGGQMRDIEAEIRPPGEAEAELIPAMKTASLIAAAAAMGARLGSAGKDPFEALHRYGHDAGLAFQLADDILDVTQSSEALGKTAGKDGAQHKATLVARLGIETARARRDGHVEKAIGRLDGFGPEADRLRELVRYFAARQA
ncbi:MAG TPA: farnesyl diphosphate synthase [Devosiaceae bacterium]|nr:farnesyl diphosphate synthase [Devosiaceae bacterium]